MSVGGDTAFCNGVAERSPQRAHLLPGRHSVRSGNPDDLYREYEIDSDSIMAASFAALGM